MERLRYRPTGAHYTQQAAPRQFGEEGEGKEEKGRGGEAWGEEMGQTWVEFIRG